MSAKLSPAPLFLPGQCVISQGAVPICEQHQIDPADLIVRHLHGDHGTLHPDDLAVNQQTGYPGGTVRSEYRFGADRIWVCTEPGHHTTTIYVPDEH